MGQQPGRHHRRHLETVRARRRRWTVFRVVRHQDRPRGHQADRAARRVGADQQPHVVGERSAEHDLHQPGRTLGACCAGVGAAAADEPGARGPAGLRRLGIWLSRKSRPARDPCRDRLQTDGPADQEHLHTLRGLHHPHAQADIPQRGARRSPEGRHHHVAAGQDHRRCRRAAGHRLSRRLVQLPDALQDSQHDA